MKSDKPKKRTSKAKAKQDNEAVSVKLSITYYVVIPAIIIFFLWGFYMYQGN